MYHENHSDSMCNTLVMYFFNRVLLVPSCYAVTPILGINSQFTDGMLEDYVAALCHSSNMKVVVLSLTPNSAMLRNTMVMCINCWLRMDFWENMMYVFLLFLK